MTLKIRKKKQTDPTMEKNSGRIPRHTYRAEDIMTCLMLYVYCGCSYRSIPKALRVMRLRTGGEVGDFPDHTTVKGWVEKAGLAELNRLRSLFKSNITPEADKPKLDEWCKDVGKSLIRELISVRDTIRQKETEILNYFTNRSTNASAESLNSKIKGFRAQLRGVQDLPFFMYRLVVLFG